VISVAGWELPEAALRRFARDQWVRVHGTPRVTVLVGGDHARACWRAWLDVSGLAGELLPGALATVVADAAAQAMAHPARPIAISCTRDELAAWRGGRRADRLTALIDEGVVELPDPAPAAPPPAPAPAPDRQLFNARSAAELTLYDALEATPATAGRFERNGLLSIHFGNKAAEVDLLARKDRVAVEVDGYYHFTDLDAYRRDRKKDLLLQTHGLLVVRVLAEDVMQDARPAVNAICQALAARKKDSP
jgi:very-short-patch-repair endonuclease